MKIVIYGANFAPEPTGIGKYSGEMAEWLVAQGHEVRAISAVPYYPSWRIDPKYRWRSFTREQWSGVDVWRAPLWVPRSPTGTKRVLHLVSFALASFPIILFQMFWRPDLVITIAPAFVCAPAGLLTARLCGAQAWLHMQDFEVDIAFRMNILRGKTLQRIILRMESWILRRFDTVSSISHRMVSGLLRKGVAAEKIRFFPNWVDTSLIKASAPRPAYRRQLNIADDAIVVLFSGTLGGKQGLMVVPETAACLLARENIVFVICGDGVMKPQLQAACANLSNTRFLPLQRVERLGELLNTADIHLLPQSHSAEDLVLPSKLSGMLASGRPVIATCRAGTEVEMTVSKCGLVVEPEDSTALAAAICRLVDDVALRTHLGRTARAYAEANFERHAVLERTFGPYTDGEAPFVDDVAA
jgi:colanic acid biosynthesis glycosyl transferase WcaI